MLIGDAEKSPYRETLSFRPLISPGKQPKEKFLLFPQFADTVSFLCDALNAAGLDTADCVTGSSDNPAEQAWQFSPESNDKLPSLPPGSKRAF